LQDADKEADQGRHVIRLTGKTIGQHWDSLDDAEKRAWLLDLGWKAYALLPEGVDVPAVVIESENSIFDDLATLYGLTIVEIMALDWLPILAAARQRGLPMDPDELVRLASNPDEIERLVRQQPFGL
jgi:hypothetical protein